MRMGAAFTGGDQETVVGLGLGDESGFRGWGGGGKKVFTISATDATPSFLPGIIRPGEWKLLLGIPNIREGVKAQYTAKIYFSSSEREDCLRLLEPPLRSAASWYKGDLHMHTGNSHGSC